MFGSWMGSLPKLSCSCPPFYCKKGRERERERGWYLHDQFASQSAAIWMDSLDDQCSCKPQLLQPDDSRPLLLRLREILASCSETIGTGDPRKTENAVQELVEFLASVSDGEELDADSECMKNTVLEVLSEIYKYMCAPSLDQEMIDALSFELPKAVGRFVSVDGCLEIVDGIIDRLITVCSPRDMLSILCEALEFQSNTPNASSYIPYLNGISKVIPSVQRRGFEQVKVAVPVILNALNTATSKSYDGDKGLDKLFEGSLGIANSIIAVCAKLEGEVNKRLRSLLGLYILQIMALISMDMGNEVSTRSSLITRLSHFFPLCGLSYLGLMTEDLVDRMINDVIDENEDDYIECLSYVKHSASLSVIWGNISEEVAQAAEENLNALKCELHNDRPKRWQAISMLKLVFSSFCVPWNLKKHAIDFLLSIIPENVPENFYAVQTACSSYMPGLFAALQAVQLIIMHAPDPTLRKNAFVALKKVLADLPAVQRLDILNASIQKTESPSMIAILLDHVRWEMYMEFCQKTQIGNKDTLPAEPGALAQTSFWTSRVIELVDFILKPSKGGPPCLPEQSDAVLSALNLYRYVHLTESAGKTNNTGVLSRENLQKAYYDWLLPLRTLVTGIMAENKGDNDELTVDVECVLNPVELVLYRCIELVEEKLRQTTI